MSIALLPLQFVEKHLFNLIGPLMNLLARDKFDRDFDLPFVFAKKYL